MEFLAWDIFVSCFPGCLPVRGTVSTFSVSGKRTASLQYRLVLWEDLIESRSLDNYMRRFPASLPLHGAFLTLSISRKESPSFQREFASQVSPRKMRRTVCTVAGGRLDCQFADGSLSQTAYEAPIFSRQILFQYLICSLHVRAAELRLLGLRAA
jgi:hypothetical protein